MDVRSLYLMLCKHTIEDNSRYDDYEDFKVLDTDTDDEIIIKAHKLHNLALLFERSFSVLHSDGTKCTWKYQEHRCFCGKESGYYFEDNMFHTDWLNKMYIFDQEPQGEVLSG